MNRFMQHYLYENPLGLKRLLGTPTAATEDNHNDNNNGGGGSSCRRRRYLWLAVAVFTLATSALALHHHQQCLRSLGDTALAQLATLISDHHHRYGNANNNSGHNMRPALWSLLVVLIAWFVHWLYHRPLARQLAQRVCDLLHSPAVFYYIVRLLMLILLTGILFPMPKVTFTLTHIQIDLEHETPVRSEFVLTSQAQATPANTRPVVNKLGGGGAGDEDEDPRVTTIVSLLGEQKLYEMLYLFSIQLVEQRPDGTLIGRHVTFGEKCHKLLRYCQATGWKLGPELYCLGSIIVLEVISYLCFAFMFEPFAMLLFYLVQAIAFDAKTIGTR